MQNVKPGTGPEWKSVARQWNRCYRCHERRTLAQLDKAFTQELHKVDPKRERPMREVTRQCVLAWEAMHKRHLVPIEPPFTYSSHYYGLPDDIDECDDEHSQKSSQAKNDHSAVEPAPRPVLTVRQPVQVHAVPLARDSPSPSHVVCSRPPQAQTQSAESAPERPTTPLSSAQQAMEVQAVPSSTVQSHPVSTSSAVTQPSHSESKDLQSAPTSLSTSSGILAPDFRGPPGQPILPAACTETMPAKLARMKSSQNRRQSTENAVASSHMHLAQAGQLTQLPPAPPLAYETHLHSHIAKLQQVHNETLQILLEEKRRAELYLNSKNEHLEAENRRLVSLGLQQYDEHTRWGLSLPQHYEHALQSLQQGKERVALHMNSELDRLQLLNSRLQAENTALRQTCNNFAQEVENREREENQRKRREEEEARREAYRRETQEMLGQNRVM